MKSNEPKLLEYMKNENIDAFLVSDPTNVRYISAFSASDGAQKLLLTKEGKLFFITDTRYSEDAAMECPDYEVVIWRTPGNTVGKSVSKLLKENNCNNVAIEGDEFLYTAYKDFEGVTDAKIIVTNNVISDMRMIKSPEEIQYQRDACEISCRALEKLLPEIKVGVTEKELAAKLSLYMVQHGADTMPYGNILISGARSSLLHGVPTQKSIEYGDFVLMDFGCQVNGYMSDMTRTVVVGRATEEQKVVYELEKKMLEDCMSITKAGVTGKEIYLKSLEAIKDTPYMGYQYNNIGHGIGLFVHEGPFDSEQDTTPIPAGNVRTIEPGLYIPGWGGVRIEDQLLVTEDGYENMVDFTRELIEL
ncbi:MAG: aminopeptidase P family protein [Clostridiales bacterium]|jgi:Xaa-Pro aminopeptidase|nr:aminopeptidase P family protein [Clostridiales bacterium]